MQRVKGQDRRPRTSLVIPVRMGSTRLPGKALRTVGERPMLWHLTNRLRHCTTPDTVVVAAPVSAENDAIAEFCRKHGLRCVRGPEDDVLGRTLMACRATHAEVGILVFGDGPLIDPGVIDYVAKAFLVEPSRYEFVGNDLLTTYPPGNEVEVFAVAALADAAARCHDPAIREHGTLFMRMNPTRYRLKNVAAPARYHRSDISLEVDTEEDLAVIEAIIGRFTDVTQVGLSEILAFLDKHPGIVAKNRNVPRRWHRYRHPAVGRAYFKTDGLQTLGSLPRAKFSPKFSF